MMNPASPAPSAWDAPAPFAWSAGPRRRPPRLRFDPPRDDPPPSAKRHRLASDVDGDGLSPRPKKRRLRLNLITSRLSRPFAAPSTYIGGRGAVWATHIAVQRRMGRSVLRKAAIVNWMRIRHGVPLSPTDARAAADGDAYGPWMRGVEDTSGEDDVYPPPPVPSPSLAPRSPSPPGLSNYHALDLEDSPFDEGSWSESEDMDLDSRARLQRDDTLVDPRGLVLGMAARAWKQGDFWRNDRSWTALLDDDEARHEMPRTPFSRPLLC